MAYNPNEPWTGIWSVKRVSGYASGGRFVLKLKQTANKVKSIRGSSYDVRAKVKGNRLKGRYTGGFVDYLVELKISQDFMSFEGKQSYHGKTTKLKGERQE